MKYLIIIAITLITSCVTDPTPPDLSSIEAKHEALQTKVDSLSQIPTKVDTVVINDTVTVFDTLVVNDTSFVVTKDTMFFVTNDTMVVRDTLVEFVQQDVVKSVGVERFNRADFDLADLGYHMYSQEYTYCSEDNPRLIIIQLSGTDDGVFVPLSLIVDLFDRHDMFLSFVHNNCSFSFATNDLDYLLANYQYYKIIMID
jgi:hypothetical protein